jgi:hypothetical protein
MKLKTYRHEKIKGTNAAPHAAEKLQQADY